MVAYPQQPVAPFRLGQQLLASARLVRRSDLALADSWGDEVGRGSYI